MLNKWLHAFLLAMVVTIATPSSFTSAFAAGNIGRVKAVIFAAYGTPPAESRQTLYTRDHVFANEVVETNKKSALHLTFLDKTIFRLGAESRATLDTFIYDPDSKAGELTLSLTEGIFRIKTGKMKKEGIRVLTPVAVITVTGTDFIVQVLADLIRVAVLKGEVNISPTAPGAPRTTLGARAMGEIDSGGAVTLDVGPPSDPGLKDDAASGTREGGGGGGNNPQ
ncbi:MAG: FecR family protein [Kiloniellales bacterium]